MVKIKTAFTWIANFIGVFVLALVTTQITTGKSIGANGISLQLKNEGLIIWLVLLVAYFWGAKKFWGKTAGGLLAAKLLGGKK